MANYVESLGNNANLHDVFQDLFGQARQLTVELQELQKERDPKRLSRTIADTKLELLSSSGRCEDDSHVITTYIGAWTGLYSPSRFLKTTINRSAHSQIQPLDVSSYRGGELSGDYSLHLEKVGSKDLIIALGKTGIYFFADETVGNEPVGECSYELRTKLKKLKPEDYQRLGVVTQGIVGGIEVVKLIRDGKDPKEAAVAVGKPLTIRTH